MAHENETKKAPATAGAFASVTAEYADWVQVEAPVTSGSRCIVLRIVEYDETGMVARQHGAAAWFVPPRPKPTVPDVKPGAVVEYTDHYGQRCRVMRSGDGFRPWFTEYSTFSDAALLKDCDEDGLTVVLGGLE